MRILAVAILHVGRTPSARVVTASRSLDLDHVGAQVGEDLAAPRPRQYATHVEHPNMGESTGGKRESEVLFGHWPHRVLLGGNQDDSENGKRCGRNVSAPISQH